MNYKLCRRCKFKVPMTLKLCQVCGSEEWLTNASSHSERVFFGSQENNLLLKFRRILAEWPFATAEGVKAEQTWQPKESTRISRSSNSQDGPNLELAPRQEISELELSAVADHRNGKSDREITKLKQEIDELSQWFRSYGSEGLLTHRG